MQALLLCDDPDETAVLLVALQRIGATVNAASDLVRGLRDWDHNPSDMILLALHQRGTLDHIVTLRRQSEALLGVIAPQDDEDALARLLEAGADWVVARPYSTRLLIAQMRALLRRGYGASPVSLPYLTVGPLTLDPAGRTVHGPSSPPRRLTQLEFRLLYTLMTHRGQVLPTTTLIERVWGYEGEGSMDLVRGLVRRLRSKVEPNPSEPRYVLTVPGVGYRLGGEDEHLPETA